MNFQITANPNDTTAESSLMILDGEVFIVDTNMIEFLQSPPSVRLTKKIWSIDDSDGIKTLVTKDTQYRVKYYPIMLFEREHRVQIGGYQFKNSNPFDCRKSNIRPIFSDLMSCEEEIQNSFGYTIHELVRYHVPMNGVSAGQIMNPVWNVTDSDGNNFLLMYCKENTYTKLSVESLGKLNEFYEKYRSSWYYNGEYIQTHFKIDDKRTGIYLHQYLMNLYGQKRNQTHDANLSVDHINQDKLDNQLINLRIVTQSVQNSNQGKKTRPINAKKLPDELIGISIPKCINYNSENYSKNGGPSNPTDARIVLPEDANAEKPIERYQEGFRHFFRFEKKIPGTEKKNRWTGTKSMEIPILAKLEEAIFVANYFNQHKEFPSKELTDEIIQQHL